MIRIKDQKAFLVSDGIVLLHIRYINAKAKNTSSSRTMLMQTASDLHFRRSGGIWLFLTRNVTKKLPFNLSFLDHLPTGFTE